MFCCTGENIVYTDGQLLLLCAKLKAAILFPELCSSVIVQGVVSLLS